MVLSDVLTTRWKSAQAMKAVEVSVMMRKAREKHPAYKLCLHWNRMRTLENKCVRRNRAREYPGSHNFLLPLRFEGGAWMQVWM